MAIHFFKSSLYFPLKTYVINAEGLNSSIEYTLGWAFLLFDLLISELTCRYCKLVILTYGLKLTVTFK